MSTAVPDGDAGRDLIGRVEALLEDVERVEDPAARDQVNTVVAALLELYGEGLERIVAAVAARDDDGELAAGFADDELISHLLLIHDLHPVALEERVRGALEEVRPYLESHGGDVELLEIDAGVVRLRLQGSCSGCPSSTVTLKLAIEEAIHKAAPEIEQIEADGVQEPVPAPGPAVIQLEIAGALRAGPAAGEPAWSMAGGVPEVPGGGPVLKRVSGSPILFVKLAEDVFAYRPTCPQCHASLEDAVLTGATLACSGCGRRYDVRRAGRCDDAPALHLDPLPLLVDDSGLVKVALGSAAA